MSSSSSTEDLWVEDIESATLKNKFWRDVLFTSDNLQVVVMSVPPKQSLGWEMHRKSDQFFRIEGGKGLFQIGEKEGGKVSPTQEALLEDGMVTVIPHGTWHNVTNTSSRSNLKFYAIYGPPHHRPGTRDTTHRAEKIRTSKRRR